MKMIETEEQKDKTEESNQSEGPMGPSKIRRAHTHTLTARTSPEDRERGPEE